MTKTECITVTTEAGTGELCATIRQSGGEGGGYFSGEARLTTGSTVLSVATLRLTVGNHTFTTPVGLGFTTATATLGPQLTATTGEACASGGVGIDSKDFGTICVTLP